MPSNISDPDHRSSDSRGDGFSLARGNARSGYCEQSDYIVRERHGNFAPSRGGRHSFPGGTNGVEYGWGRRGRVRLDPPIFLRDPGSPLNRCYGRQGDQNHSRVTQQSQRTRDSEHILHSDCNGLSALTYLPTALRAPARQYQADLLLENDLYEPDMLIEKDHNRPSVQFGNGFHGLEPYMRRALTGLELGPGFGSDFGPDYDTRSSLDSLNSVSQYSLQHLDRLKRSYHYQSPYVEDYESQLDELGQLDELDSLHDMIIPAEFSHLLSPREGFLPGPTDTA